MFLKLSGGLVILTACGNEFTKESKLKKHAFKIHIDANNKTGHLVRTAIQLPISNTIETETLIVGAGIAGLAAACSLKSNDFQLCELNPNFGGTSGAININGSLYSQGAHYDLSYPNNYGEDGLQLLEKLNIIQFNSLKQLWEFKDKQHIIASKNEEACYENGELRPSILKDSELKKNFIDLLRTYENQFPLPSTSIHSELHHLDHINFEDFLSKYLPVDNHFLEAIDYQMLDDYGGRSSQISALAGIHYYKCRPYYNGKELELFSPQKGNYYFIEKMANSLPEDNLKKNHLVFGIKKLQNKWQADVLDIDSMTRKQFLVDKLIYAGQKHVLKYTHPESYAEFSDVSYAPWVVINIELDNSKLEGSKWQNDFLSSNRSFLGFVDSNMQNDTTTRVLTAYYCFSDIHHYIVQNLSTNAENLVNETIQNISLYFKRDISQMVKQVHVKLLGHAMPIPQLGYMTKQRVLENDGLAFAGADTGRLPLMFDAMDSGIQASKTLES